MKNILTPTPLSAESFAPFGDVLQDKTASVVKDINENTTKRFHDLAKISGTNESGGQVGISLFRGNPRPRPIRIAMLEHHPLASQAFLPAINMQWLVVVALGDDKTHPNKPDTKTIKCFLAEGEQGVNYHAGVWHHPLLTFNPQDFWVIDRIGKADESANVNLCEYWFDESEICWIDV